MTASTNPTAPRSLRAGALGCLRPQPGAAARLVCFAHAGGGPGSYLKWPGALGPEVEVWTATLPGRAHRSDEPFARSWPALVGELADALAGPGGLAAPGGATRLALLGHSLGGLAAYEVTRELERRGAGPAHLFVSGGRAPHRIDARWRPPPDDDRLVAEVDQRWGAVPAAVRDEPELLARFVPILRADLELAAAYRWRAGAGVRCPVTALAGIEDKTAPPHEVRHWREHVDGEFRAATLPGAHFFLHAELPAVAELIRRAVAGPAH